jgi:hypothetical protein
MRTFLFWLNKESYQQSEKLSAREGIEITTPLADGRQLIAISY